MSESQQHGNDLAGENTRTDGEADEREVYTTSVREVDPEAKKEIATAALQGLSLEDRSELIGQLQALPDVDRAAIVNSLMPTQPVTDWVWKVIVGTFALVFILAALALCAAALWFPDDNLQILLTVVTTIAGILAGFISGRASTNNVPPSMRERA